MNACKCGCGLPVRRGRTFVNKEHQLDWMASGGAREMNALMSPEARAFGGYVSGTGAVASGRQREMAAAGAQRSREIARAFRERRQRQH